MTTKWTKMIAVLAEEGSGPEEAIQNRIEPDGDHVLFGPDAKPTYKDPEDGTEYLYTEAVETPTRQDALRGIENSPQITVVDVAEWREDPDVEMYGNDQGGMVRLVDREDVVDGLEPIEIESDL